MARAKPTRFKPLKQPAITAVTARKPGQLIIPRKNGAAQAAAQPEPEPDPVPDPFSWPPSWPPFP